MYKEMTFQSQPMALVIVEQNKGMVVACVEKTDAAQWLQKVSQSELLEQDMWWLSDEQLLPYFDFNVTDTTDEEGLLRQLDASLDQRRLIGRQFFWHLRLQKLTSYKISLPETFTPQSEYERKTTMLRYFNKNTNLHSGMKLRDVFDEGQAADAVILGYNRAARSRSSKSIKLAHTEMEGDTQALNRIVSQRRSLKKYNNLPISFETLSSFLEISAGVSRQVRDKQENELAFYNYPVGGGIKSTHLYFYANHVPSLEKGFYYYNPTTSSVEAIDSDVTLQQLAKGTAYYEAIAHCSVLCFVVGDYYAKSLKYLDRAYRIVLSESGHLSQNMHLTATSLALKSCVLMGFDDELYAKSIGLNTNQQCVVSLLTVGR